MLKKCGFGGGWHPLSALGALPVRANMLLAILLLNLVLTDAAKSSPKQGESGLEDLVEKLESRLREMELRLEETEMRMEKEKTKPSLRDLPIVLISAWQPNILRSPQTVTFESFLTDFNNADRPGGGSGDLDLDSGIFTCFTPGYYTVSFSAHGVVGPSYDRYQYLHLHKNGVELPESNWYVATDAAGLNDNIGVTGSRILVSRISRTCLA